MENKISVLNIPLFQLNNNNIEYSNANINIYPIKEKDLLLYNTHLSFTNLDTIIETDNESYKWQLSHNTYHIICDIGNTSIKFKINSPIDRDKIFEYNLQTSKFTSATNDKLNNFDLNVFKLLSLYSYSVYSVLLKENNKITNNLISNNIIEELSYLYHNLSQFGNPSKHELFLKKFIKDMNIESLIDIINNKYFNIQTIRETFLNYIRQKTEKIICNTNTVECHLVNNDLLSKDKLFKNISFIYDVKKDEIKSIYSTFLDELQSLASNNTQNNIDQYLRLYCILFHIMNALKDNKQNFNIMQLSFVNSIKNLSNKLYSEIKQYYTDKQIQQQIHNSLNKQNILSTEKLLQQIHKQFSYISKNAKYHLDNSKQLNKILDIDKKIDESEYFANNIIKVKQVLRNNNSHQNVNKIRLSSNNKNSNNNDINTDNNYTDNSNTNKEDEMLNNIKQQLEDKQQPKYMNLLNLNKELLTPEEKVAKILSQVFDTTSIDINFQDQLYNNLIKVINQKKYQSLIHNEEGLSFLTGSILAITPLNNKDFNIDNTDMNIVYNRMINILKDKDIDTQSTILPNINDKAKELSIVVKEKFNDIKTKFLDLSI